MRIWPAADTPVDDYPDDLPFVPNAEVGIEDEDNGACVVMKWWGVERPLEVMQQLLGASVRDGWTLHDEDPPATGDTGSVRRMRFVRDDRERVIETVQAAPFSFVTLTERPSE